MEVSCDRRGSSDGPDEHITQTVPTGEMNTSPNMRKYYLVLGERGIQVLDIVTAASSAPVVALTTAAAAVPSTDASKISTNNPGRQQQPAPAVMEDAGLPPRVMAESAGGGEDISPSPVVQDDTDTQFHPPVKMEEGETGCILPEVGTVSASEERFERDPLELTSSEVKCKVENVPQSTPPPPDLAGSIETQPRKEHGPVPAVMDGAVLPPPLLAESADSGEDIRTSSVIDDHDDVMFQPTVKVENGGEAEVISPEEVETVSAPEECPESDPLELTCSEAECEKEDVIEAECEEEDVIEAECEEEDVIEAECEEEDVIEAECEEADVIEAECEEEDVIEAECEEEDVIEAECEEEDVIEAECEEADVIEAECEEEDVIEAECEEEDVIEDVPVPESPLFEDFNGFTATDLNKTLEAVRSKVQLLYRCIAAKPQATRNAASSSRPKRCRPVGSHREDDLDENSTGDATGSYCDQCYCEWAGGCPLHGTMEVIPDTKVPADTGDPERCIKTLPECLKAGRSRIQVADNRLNGILAQKDVPSRQRFGPYEGTITSDGSQARTIGYSWQIKRFYDVHHHVSAADPSSSNWLRLVNCARTEEEQNLTAFQYKYRIYYRTCKPIAKGTELLVYFGDDYVRDLNDSVQTCTEPEQTPPREQVPTAEQASPSTSSSGEETPDLKRNRLDRLVKKRQQHISGNGRHKCSPTTDKGATVQQYKCKWCPFSTDKPGRLGRHRKTHTEKRPHRCDVCGVTFNLLRNLTRHHRLHTDERQHKCDVCGKAFLQLGAMMHHRRVHTAGEKRYKCDVCVKAFTTMSDLKTHRRIHTGEKVRQCDQCGASFSVISNYTRHMRNHSGIKAHRCQVCTARFVHRTSLTEHMRTHTDKRPHACSFCPARFANQSARNRHVVFIHTHDYRHRCDRCGKGFVVPSLLQKHMAKCVAGN